MSTLGIIGAGKVGMTIARLAQKAGWDVNLSGSPRQPFQAMIVETLAPGARLLPEAEVVAAADIVIVAIPFNKADEVDWSALSGKIVVDAMNYWYAVDGTIDAVEAFPGSNSEFTQARNPEMRLVKSLNHLGYNELESHAGPSGDPLRRALSIASDDDAAAASVAALVDALGFDPILLPSLAAGRVLEADGPVFGLGLTRSQMIEILEEAGVTGIESLAPASSRN